MSQPPRPLSWFEGFGIELEWMVVDESTLSVLPIVDRVLERLAGAPAMEVLLGPVAWSNELALHVIEVKTNGPARELEGAAVDLAQGVSSLLPLLSEHGARLMPTAMHPLMDPEREFVLWPRDEEGIYATFNRIFDCRGHGWSNLQSMHINLPFANDEQFGRLHDAVRVLLPLLPALAASSPLKDGAFCPNLNQRILTYRDNARKVPSVSGRVIPERASSREEYETRVLAPIYRALAPHDPQGVLRHEWVNARGAIARFDRNAIEIRLLDVQESVRASLAIAHGVTEVLRQVVLGEGWVFAGSEARLLALLMAVARDAERAVIEDRDYLDVLGIRAASATAAEVWAALLERVPRERRAPRLWATLEELLQRGCLARRIHTALGGSTERRAIERVYTRLCDCLERDEVFAP